MRKNFCKKIIVTGIVAMVMTAACCISAMAGTTVEYSALRDLLKAGNTTMESLNENLQNIEDQISVLESSQFAISSLEDQAKASGDKTSEASYDMTNSMLYSTVGSLKKSLASQTKAGSSYDKALNSLEKSAQTMMISYKTMEYNADAAKKSYDAAVDKYNTTLNKYVAGMASEADVNTASSNMDSAKNMYESYSQQASSLRYKFLQMLGIVDDGSVTIGEIPDPDVNTIKAVDPEANLNTYVGYDNDVISSRHLSSTNRNKEAALTEADGTATAEYWEMYNKMMTDLTQYNAASEAFAAAQKQYETAQHKHSVGMLTDGDLASAEATYASALATYKSRANNLTQSYSDYLWSLKGL